MLIVQKNIVNPGLCQLRTRDICSNIGSWNLHFDRSEGTAVWQRVSIKHLFRHQRLSLQGHIGCLMSHDTSFLVCHIKARSRAMWAWPCWIIANDSVEKKEMLPLAPSQKLHTGFRQACITSCSSSHCSFSHAFVPRTLSHFIASSDRLLKGVMRTSFEAQRKPLPQSSE